MDTVAVRPQDIRYVSDSVRLPLLTREDVRRSFPTFLVSTHARRPTIARTGGSTGNPLVFYVDKNVRTAERACYYRFLSWTGFQLGEPMVRLWGAPVVSSPAARLRQFAKHQLYRIDSYDCFKLDERLFKEVSTRIQRLKPSLILRVHDRLGRVRGLCSNARTLISVVKGRDDDGRSSPR